MPTNAETGENTAAAASTSSAPVNLAKAPKADSDWLRLSPWSILHFAASTIMQVVNNAIALVPLVVGIAVNVDRPWLVGALLVLALTVLTIAFATLRYFYFTYRLDQDSVQVREGVLQKTQLNLRFDRVQNVNLAHPFYFRPLHLVTVRIDSAGSAGNEIQLAALSQSGGEAIRERIRSYQRGHSTATATASANAEPIETLILTRSLGDLVLHGLTNNRAWLILAAAFAVLGQTSDFAGDLLDDWSADIGATAASLALPVLLLIIAGLALGGVIVMATISVIGSILVYYDFALFRTAEGFRVARGLLTKQEVSIRQSRIQAVWLRRDWLDHLFGRLNLGFEQVSHGNAGAGIQLAGQTITVPSVTMEQANTLQYEAIAAPAVTDLPYARVHWQFLVRSSLLLALPYVFIAAVFVNLDVLSLGWAAALQALGCLHLIFNFLRVRRYGLCMTNDHIVVRSGLIGVRYVAFPTYKLQKITRTTARYMRRHGLSSLSFTIASRVATVPCLPDATVLPILNRALFQSESARRSWM